MIRFCWVHVSFNFVVGESSSLRKGRGLWVAHSSLEGFIFLCKMIWTYKELAKTTFGGVPISFKLAIVGVKWMSLKCWLHFKIAIKNLKSVSTKLLSAKAWFRSGVQVTFILTTKMTSGPLYRHLWSFPFQPSRDFWLLPSILSLVVVSGWNYLSKTWVGQFQ